MLERRSPNKHDYFHDNRLVWNFCKILGPIFILNRDLETPLLKLFNYPKMKYL
jgi:hypothetical protein